MRWAPLMIVIGIGVMLGFWFRYELVTHGGWSIYAVAPIVMFLFVCVFVVFLSKGGSGPTKPGFA